MQEAQLLLPMAQMEARVVSGHFLLQVEEAEGSRVLVVVVEEPVAVVGRPVVGLLEEEVGPLGTGRGLTTTRI